MQLDKDKIKKSMIEHLKSKGWSEGDPGSDNIVMNELQAMFGKLVNEGLIPPNSANDFFNAAVIQKQTADFFKAFQGR